MFLHSYNKTMKGEDLDRDGGEENKVATGGAKPIPASKLACFCTGQSVALILPDRF